MNSLSVLLRKLLASSRVRYALWSIAAVVALAAVILATAALTAPKRPDASLPAITVDDSDSDPYAQGMRALASGETTAAVSLLKKAAAAGNENARVKLREIETPPEEKPISIPPTQPGDKPKDLDAGYTGQLEPASLLPSGVSGLRPGSAETGGGTAQLPLEPDPQGRYAGSVTRVVLTVLDASSPAKAQSYVDGLGRAYPDKLGRVTIGIVTGKTGTDGQHSASVVFRRGRYVFETVLTGPGDAADIQSLAAEVAKAFPASK